jgi:hypothetical protein
MEERLENKISKALAEGRKVEIQYVEGPVKVSKLEATTGWVCVTATGHREKLETVGHTVTIDGAPA